MLVSDPISTSEKSKSPNGKRYFSTVGDVVVGVIVQKTADQFKVCTDLVPKKISRAQVDIGAPFAAVLSNTAFNAASKRHRPNLKLGQVMICHVISADKNLDTELSCEDPTTQKDWVTNEVYFGALSEGGLLLDLPVRMGKTLMSRNSNLFSLIGQYLKPFEVAIGVNGKVYVKTAEGDNKRAVLIADVIRKSDKTDVKDLEMLCQEAERKVRH